MDNPIPKSRVNLADLFISLHQFSDKIKELHNFPDIPDSERRQIKAAVKIIKMDIEELLESISQPQTE